MYQYTYLCTRNPLSQSMMDNATDEDNPSGTHTGNQPRKKQRTSLAKSVALNTMPCSYDVRLEELCKSTYNTGDFSVAKIAVETLIKASDSGCIFLERYIVMLLDYCTQRFPTPSETDSPVKLGIDELLDKILSVRFDKQQLTENLRKPEYKLTSIKQIMQLFRRVQEKLDYRDPGAVDWLLAVLDAYFVELVSIEEAADVIDKISNQVYSQCTLLSSVESVKHLLEPVKDSLVSEKIAIRGNESSKKATGHAQQARHRRRPFYYIEEIEF